MLKILSLLIASILHLSSASAFAAEAYIGQFLYQYKAGFYTMLLQAAKPCNGNA